MEFTKNQKKYLYELLYDCGEVVGAISFLLKYNSENEFNHKSLNIEERIKNEKIDLGKTIKYIEEDYQSLLRNGWLDNIKEENEK